MVVVESKSTRAISNGGRITAARLSCLDLQLSGGAIETQDHADRQGECIKYDELGSSGCSAAPATTSRCLLGQREIARMTRMLVGAKLITALVDADLWWLIFF